MGSIGGGNRNNNTIWTANAQQLDGRPGTYRLYRSGDLSAPNGMIFFAAEPSEAEFYGEVNRDMDAYELDVQNPLVIEANGDAQAVRLAWEALHPGKELKLGSRGLDPGSGKWVQLDKQNASALNKSEHDAIIYKIDGKVKEIQIPGKQRDRLNKKDTREYLGTTTHKQSIEKARSVVLNNRGSAEQIGTKLANALNNSTYIAEYIPWMQTVSVRLRNPKSDLDKSRSSIYYELVPASGGRWFVRLTR